jgi:hypothetical protein
MSIDGRLILDVCAAVRDGGGHCFLLSGPAGCGKTHLLAHLAASEALTAAAGAVAVLRTPFDLIDTAASELAASAKVVLLDNAEFVATGLKALGAQSVLASLFRGAIARRAVLVIATTSSEPPKEIARYWPAPVRVAVPKLSREQAGHVVRLVAESERRSQELMAPVHAAVPWSVVTSLLTTGVAALPPAKATTRFGATRRYADWSRGGRSRWRSGWRSATTAPLSSRRCDDL